ncbi:PTS system cellobiose-specific IIA component [Breznakia blatticola]|uniref:PTS system cellobiose-specific IIA component n=1 Tax=Breznakia blatticola TaxID=1754012 RepID=A0A4R8A891_9FIRM|nr:PTS lactose/cellobiose transporter subunit IIA [Breznakia blatticola]TDW26101.1 PTS system cellobiose-specific IIA component [Breznakia blatticola]
MEGIELICFKMISHCGSAKSSFIESLEESRNGHFDKAQHLIRSGNDELTRGHKYHAELLTQEANNNLDAISLLLIHAEDQLMNTETVKIMAEEFLENYKMKSCSEVETV